eukprot:SAG11_NODE_320_length_10806_cov_17.415896_5_plen_82_part_00
MRACCGKALFRRPVVDIDIDCLFTASLPLFLYFAIVIMPDGTLRKERNFAKGGRRNWTRRYFVLLSNNVLVYYEQVWSAPP